MKISVDIETYGKTGCNYIIFSDGTIFDFKVSSNILCIDHLSSIIEQIPYKKIRKPKPYYRRFEKKGY